MPLMTKYGNQAPKPQNIGIFKMKTLLLSAP